MTEIAKNILRLRTERKMSQLALQTALNAGTSTTLVSFWERGIRTPNWFFVCGLADFFGISVDELCLSQKPIPCKHFNGSLGQRIAYHRERNHLTQTQLGNLLGRNQAAICQFEREVFKPSVATAIKLCDALHISMDELAGRGEGHS